MSGWDNNTWDIQDWYKEALSCRRRPRDANFVRRRRS